VFSKAKTVKLTVSSLV